MKKNEPNKPCECWTCKSLFPKVRKFESTLSPEQNELFRALFDEIWDRYENLELDHDVLLAKIDGSWPKNKEEKYFERIGGVLYEVTSTPIEWVKDSQKPNDDCCDHNFESDGGSCTKCGKTVIELM